MKIDAEHVRKVWLSQFGEMGLPYYELHDAVASFLEIVIGVILIIGYFSRVAALLVILIMVLPIYGHISAIQPMNPFTGPYEVFLPSFSIMMALLVLTYGGGNWSLDLKFYPEKF